MSEIFTCFGYGSLVNRHTLPADSVSVRVRVSGWRRAWRLSADTERGRRCTLTVIPDADCAILGTVVAQPATRADALRQREAFYAKADVPAAAIEWIDDRPPGWPDPFIHVGEPAFARAGDHDYPILLSYVETVLAGFLNTFGDDGPGHFIETTADWHVPVLNDRSNPIYPRAIALTAQERGLVDRLLTQAGVTPVEMPALQSQPTSVSEIR